MRRRVNVFGFGVPILWPLAGILALVLASQPAASAHSARRHAAARPARSAHAALLPAASTRSGGRTATGYNWYPGYYVLNSKDDPATKRAILADPLVKPFTGVQFRYHWDASELTPGDYSAGFAALDADLKRVAAKGKKLLVMLTYKKFDGTPAVPADLRTNPGAWCSGSYCGEFTNGTGTSLALLWNPAVEARLKAWITAMATHLSQSPYIGSVAGIVFNETALGTTDTTVLASAAYNPDTYIQALEDNLLAATTAAPRLITILYYEGGFVSMDGKAVNAGQKIGDWLLQHPRAGAGTPDLKPKNPKDTKHPCANPAYQAHIVCAPAVQAPDYSTKVTDSFDQSFRYATQPATAGLHASFLTFSYAVGSGDNAFTFADVSRDIASHPIPNTAPPWPGAQTTPVVKKISLTSPVRVGQTASLSVSVSPPARCTAKVPRVKGLRVKSGGKITWRWRVTTPPGRWTISVSCDNKATLKLPLRVRPR
jgi:hypothetical protein